MRYHLLMCRVGEVGLTSGWVNDQPIRVWGEAATAALTPDGDEVRYTSEFRRT